jgi:tetratricopeptide (TPR) repeat protein
VPNDPVALKKLAAIYLKNGSVERAVQAYETVLKRSPDDSQVTIQLARLYANPPLTNFSRALELARRAQRISPQDPYIAETLGGLACQNGEYRFALSLLQDAARRLPNRPELLFDMALATYGVGRVPEALSTAQSALQVNAPFNRKAEAERFVSLVTAQSDPVKALAMAQAETLSKSARDPIPALMVLGTAEQSRTNYARAKQHYEKVLSGNPLFLPAARELAIVSAQMPDVDVKAFDSGMRARELYPNDLALARALGILAFKRGDFTRATQFLKDVTAKSPTDGEALFYLGMAQYKANKFAESRETLNSALKAQLPAHMKEEAQKALETMSKQPKKE